MIFETSISYAWEDESEKIVNKIEILFKNKKINLIRDKKHLEYKGNIKDFMNKIGKGKAVIAVISQKYLKSYSCMYELLETYRNLDFEKTRIPHCFR